MQPVVAGYLLGAGVTLSVIVWAVRGSKASVPKVIAGVAFWPILWLVTIGLEILTLIGSHPTQD